MLVALVCFTAKVVLAVVVDVPVAAVGGGTAPDAVGAIGLERLALQRKGGNKLMLEAAFCAKPLRDWPADGNQ